LREKLNLTQPEMADKMGIPLGTWNSWEYGKRTPSANAINSLLALNKNEQ
jgi:DNA-binding transcriptional regulator YiaG